MVPVSNANAVGLRQVISEQEIREIFDILKERTIGFDTQTWNRRYRGFMDKIKTGSIYDVAEVLRDLYRLKANKQLSFGERRMLDTARSLIVKEIAIAREQTEEQVKTGDRSDLLQQLIRSHCPIEDDDAPQRPARLRFCSASQCPASLRAPFWIGGRAATPARRASARPRARIERRACSVRAPRRGR